MSVSQSERFTDVALTRTRTWSGPGSGTGTSTTLSTRGGPYRSYRTALISLPVVIASATQTCPYGRRPELATAVVATASLTRHRRVRDP